MHHEIDIDLPVRTVYNQWTQFEDFPLFMEYVEHVKQLDDATLDWKVKILGVERSWRAEITEQTPDQRIAWTATDGTENGGVVTFHPLTDTTTRVVLQLEMDPQGFLESVADWGGVMKDRSKKDLESFKEFIEARGSATGQWRGTIEREPDRGVKQRAEQLINLSDTELAKRAEATGIDRPLGRDREELAHEVARREMANA